MLLRINKEGSRELNLEEEGKEGWADDNPPKGASSCPAPPPPTWGMAQRETGDAGGLRKSPHDRLPAPSMLSTRGRSRNDARTCGWFSVFPPADLHARAERVEVIHQQLAECFGGWGGCHIVLGGATPQGEGPHRRGRGHTAGGGAHPREEGHMGPETVELRLNWLR